MGNEEHDHGLPLARVGWKCPVCERVYAPWISECARCNKRAEQLKAAHRHAVLPYATQDSTPPPPESMPHIAPPTYQCVDCPHGEITQDQDFGAAPCIICSLYGTVMDINDTCINNQVDISTMGTHTGERKL